MYVVIQELQCLQTDRPRELEAALPASSDTAYAHLIKTLAPSRGEGEKRNNGMPAHLLPPFFSPTYCNLEADERDIVEKPKIPWHRRGSARSGQRL